VAVTSVHFHRPGEALTFVETPKPVLQSGELLVRNRLCTLCGSDLHTFTGRRHSPSPCVLGHEILGAVEELGPEPRRTVDGEELRIGDRVIWTVSNSCGTCFFCQNNLPQKCVQLLKYGHVAATPHQGPFGGLATHTHLLSGTSLVRIPDALSDEVATPAMCATATAAGALRVAGPVQGKRVLIIGAGMLGLTLASMNCAAGAEQILLVDPNPDRVHDAGLFGASLGILRSHDLDLTETIRGLTEGRGADIVWEMSGTHGGVADAFSSVRVGGTIVLIGSVFPSPPYPLLPEVVVRRCLTITGLHNYTPQDLVSAVRFLERNHTRFPFAELVEASFPLSQVAEAFAYAEQELPFRVAVTLDETDLVRTLPAKQ
jgi:alcohol dehydrogenase